MPLPILKPKKQINWIPIAVAAVLTIIVVGAAYFLFFAPTPGIEALVPSEQKITAQISAVRLDTRPVVEIFNSGRLKRSASPVSVGQTGRTNPFISF